jgi:hypothetical protein
LSLKNNNQSEHFPALNARRDVTIRTSMLHIFDGDSSAGTARNANLPGQHLAWREALICGPAPNNLSEPEFLEMRAHHLSSAYGADLNQVRGELRAQHDALASFRDHEEVVLWFEHDLFCQVHLLYLLNWFAQHELGPTKLSLICIDEFTGVQLFRGLGQLNEDQLTSLFPQREKVTAAQLELATRAWQAYSSSDALNLVTLGDSDTSALPFLHRAVVSHLQRFPWTGTGLGRIEGSALQLVAEGHHIFKKLFPAFSRRESEYGLGDAQLYRALRLMADAPTPVLKQSDRAEPSDAAGMLLTSFELTDDGREVLAGAQDFVVQNGIDQWLGGVHLLGPEAAWRWDRETEQLLVSL